MSPRTNAIANLRKEGPCVIVAGVDRLIAAPVMASDLRASAALVLAALTAIRWRQGHGEAVAVAMAYAEMGDLGLADHHSQGLAYYHFDALGSITNLTDPTGAAFSVWHDDFGGSRDFTMEHAYYGPGFTDERIREVLEHGLGHAIVQRLPQRPPLFGIELRHAIQVIGNPAFQALDGPQAAVVGDIRRL